MVMSSKDESSPGVSFARAVKQEAKADNFNSSEMANTNSEGWRDSGL